MLLRSVLALVVLAVATADGVLPAARGVPRLTRAIVQKRAVPLSLRGGQRKPLPRMRRRPRSSRPSQNWAQGRFHSLPQPRHQLLRQPLHRCSTGQLPRPPPAAGSRSSQFQKPRRKRLPVSQT